MEPWNLDPIPPSGVYTAIGPRILPSWLLRTLSPALGQGLELFWIDAGNGFDAYGLGRTAKAAGLEPNKVLSRIRLARPFNVFQLETMVCKTVPKVWRGEPVVLADPLVPFVDQDLDSADERRRLERVFDGIRRLPAVWLVLMVAREIPEGRQNFLDRLIKESRAVVALDMEQEPWKLTHFDPKRLTARAA